MKYIYTLIVLICLTVSCKNEKKENTNIVNKIEEAKKDSELLEKYALKVIMDFETDTKGLFQIKFRDLDKNTKPLIIYNNIKEVNSKQIISGEYNLDNNDFPLYVQFIMGESETQKIKINEIKLVTDEIMIKIDKNNFKEFINNSSFTNFDENTGILTTKRVNNSFIPAISVNKKAMDSLSFNFTN